MKIDMIAHNSARNDNVALVALEKMTLYKTVENFWCKSVSKSLYPSNQ